MRLIKLHLHGFKTFADRTEIAFNEGVTVVVGPNGSGKSNIADAILWVLGEQKASALRGSRAQDVIFAGSDSRKPTGMAEVSLTVDNSDGALPLEFNEVTITRRIYRTGDAEFFINKTPCRLKDIYELFLDTGVGRESYALVNQSEIDAVLSADPADRRGLFEEAAGIKKYRVKKREALRKLEATQTNLTRVNDILSEVSARIEPLREQSELAEQYIRLRSRLRAIESTLLIIELRSVQSDLDAVRTARQAEEEVVAKHALTLEAAELRVEGVTHRLTEADTALETARLQYQSAITQAERAQSERALAVQRAETLQDLIRRIALEREESATRRLELRTQIDEMMREIAGAQTAESTFAAEVTAHESELNAVVRELGECSRRIERRHSDAITLARKQAAQQADLARAEARVFELESALPALVADRDRLETALTAALETHGQAEIDREAARLAHAAAVEAFERSVGTRDSSIKAAEERQKTAAEIGGRQLAVTSRLRALEELEASREGYYGGVRAVFEALKRNTLAGEYILVADAFVAPQGLETALETALGASLQDIITRTEAEARAAIDHLYETRSGRATFLPLERMRPPRDAVDLGRARSSAGVLGCALDLVQFEERYRAALESLLGRVVVVETMEDGARVAREARGWSRIVTRRGEIILPSGAMSGGRQTGKQTGEILGRKNEIANLKDAAAKAGVDLVAARKAAESAREESDRAQAQMDERRAERHTAQLAETDAARRLEFAASVLRSTRDGREQGERRLSEATATLERARELFAQSRAVMATGGAESAGHDEAAAEESEELRQLGVRRETLSAQLTSARIALATEREKVASLERSYRAAVREAEIAAIREADKTRQEEAAIVESEDLSSRADSRESERDRATQHQEAALRVLEEHQHVRQELLQESYEAAAQLRSLGEARASALEAIHKHEVREARLDVQRSQVAIRLLEEYELSPEEALAAEEDPTVTDGSATEVARLRRELRQMGEVNTGAIQEYAEAVERNDFLGTQRDDLEESRGKLLDAIGEIDASTRGVFMETFQAVGRAFDELFTRLFRGGKTELVLTDPEDILETGIDILVQPPGKKRQNLALLSGGERALTATALLFAFLAVKPSPFVVLDEVDAPLDGANVERFADLVRDFAERSQFIIITHNPTTMEAAPVWYGVTMQEPGVSRVLGIEAPASTEGADSHKGSRRRNVQTAPV